MFSPNHTPDQSGMMNEQQAFVRFLMRGPAECCAVIGQYLHQRPGHVYCVLSTLCRDCASAMRAPDLCIYLTGLDESFAPAMRLLGTVGLEPSELFTAVAADRHSWRQCSFTSRGSAVRDDISNMVICSPPPSEAFVDRIQELANRLGIG
eukprot:Polyplicarium_translucidae@DN4013_c0_g1_i1.p1